MGTSKGQLLLYDCKVTPYGENVKSSLSSHQGEFTGQKKTAIIQLAAFKVLDVLFTLSDGIVSLHKLSTCEAITNLKDYKGVKLFAASLQVSWTLLGLASGSSTRALSGQRETTSRHPSSQFRALAWATSARAKDLLRHPRAAGSFQCSRWRL